MGPDFLKADGSPFVSYLDVQVSHLHLDFGTSGRLPVESKSRTFRFGAQVATNREIRFAFGTFEFDLDVASVGAHLNEGAKFIGPT